MKEEKAEKQRVAKSAGDREPLNSNQDNSNSEILSPPWSQPYGAAVTARTEARKGNPSKSPLGVVCMGASDGCKIMSRENRVKQQMGGLQVAVLDMRELLQAVVVVYGHRF